MGTKITNLTELAVTPVGTDILTIVDDPAGTPITKKITVDNLTGLVDPRGLHDAWIPASAMWLATTLPATSFTKREIATSLIDIQAMVFTSTTVDETVQFTWTLPKEWDGSTTTLTVEFFWTATGGSAGNVVWGVQAVGYANDDPLTGAFGTIAEVTDAWIANDDLHISGVATVTVGGAPVAGEMVQFKILRSGSDASDTFATAVELLGVRINYTTDKAIIT